MNWNPGHSPPFQGGVAARLQEMAPFLDWRSRGGSHPIQTTPAAPAKVASRYFLGSRPPLLGKEGNAPTIPNLCTAPMTARFPRIPYPLSSYSLRKYVNEYYVEETPK